MSGFVHLHLHTEYSLLDGACRIKDIPRLAKEMGHTAVAITDHGAMYGAVEFYKACKAEGIKAIIGCEVYVASRSRFSKEYGSDSEYSHLILLVKNEIGYKNLIYMVSKAFEEGFYSKPRIDNDLLEEHCEGLVCLSACIAGAIPRMILKNDRQGAIDYAKKLDSLFGRGNFFLEVQDHGIEAENEVNEALLDIHNETGIPLVATNDVHYLKKSDADIQAVLMCLQMNTTIVDGRPLGFETDEFYYKSTEEMSRIFGKYEGALSNTQLIADMCDFEFCFDKTYLPRYIPENKMAPEEYLRYLAYKGFSDKTENGQIIFDDCHTENEYRERIEYELSVISKMGYSEYYLIVWDFVNYAKNNRIPTGPGRGSGAGSLVAYLVGITDIDSIKHSLLFERFLNPERVSMPDFDIDFSDEKRDRVFDYVSSKYGKDRVSHIITFGTLAARACVRDVGRAMGMSYNAVARIAEAVPQRITVKNEDGTNEKINKVTLDMALETEKLKEMYENEPSTKRLIDTARALEGMPRHASTHAAGVVITDSPVYNYVPMAVTKGSLVTQFDMNTIAELGLLKFDFLGLRFLTVIENAVKNVKQKDPAFDLENIPLDDKATYKMISDGNTVGVFQMESRGMRSKLVQLRPETLADVMAAIALYRPGPMNSIGKYIENKRNKDSIDYDIEIIKPILDETFGCIVYQEQVMQIFRTVADYSFGRADIIRKAMSKKQSGRIEQERDVFLAKAKEKGIKTESATALFEELVGFCKYAFNKSHAASYAVLTYRTSYLKCHYPKEYMASLLTSVIGYEDKVKEYAEECKSLGISLLPPDINESCGYFAVVDEGIRFALLALKNVGRNFVENVVKEREKGKYASFEDFVCRMNESDLNKRQIESLIKSGCFDFSGIYRSQIMSSYEKIIESVSDTKKRNASGQLDFFSVDNELDESTVTAYNYPDINEFEIKEKLLYERESASFCFSGNLLDGYSEHEKHLNTVPMKDIINSFDKTDGDDIIEGTKQYNDRQKVVVCGIVSEIADKKTKKGEKMYFVTLEDRSASMEVIVFPSAVEEFGYMLTLDNMLALYVEISAGVEADAKLILKRATPLIPNDRFYPEPKTERHTPSAPKAVSKKKKLYLRVDDTECEAFKKAVNLVGIFEGDTEVVFYNASTKEYFSLKSAGVDLSERIIRFFSDVLGSKNVILK